jgi:hypothetical protein
MKLKYLEMWHCENRTVPKDGGAALVTTSGTT